VLLGAVDDVVKDVPPPLLLDKAGDAVLVDLNDGADPVGVVGDWLAQLFVNLPLGVLFAADVDADVKEDANEVADTGEDEGLGEGVFVGVLMPDPMNVFCLPCCGCGCGFE